MPAMMALFFLLCIPLLFLFKGKWSHEYWDFVLNLALVRKHFQLKKRSTVALCLLLGSIACLATIFIRNYSPYFPKKYEYDVYFDVEGIKETMSMMVEYAPTAISFDPSWKNDRSKELSLLDSIIVKNIPGVNNFFSYPDAQYCLHSQGNADHEFELTSKWQRYKITKVSGTIVHTLDIPNQTKTVLFSKYELLPSNFDYVQVRPLDICWRMSRIVRPIMKQSLISNGRDFYQLSIVGVTKVRLFPEPGLERSLFCIESDSGLVPICYAIYGQY